MNVHLGQRLRAVATNAVQPAVAAYNLAHPNRGDVFLPLSLRDVVGPAVARAVLDEILTDPANELDAPVPPTVLAAAYEALPHQGKGSVWWLPPAVRERMVEAVADAVWRKACDLLLGPPLTPAMVEAVRLTEAGELETFPADQEPGAACFCRSHQ